MQDRSAKQWDLLSLIVNALESPVKALDCRNSCLFGKPRLPLGRMYGLDVAIIRTAKLRFSLQLLLNRLTYMIFHQSN